MILRATAVGFVLWLIATLAFRFLGPSFFTPALATHALAFIATPVATAAIAFFLLRMLRAAPGDEAEAAIGVAFPGMILDAIVVNNFPIAFPGIDETLDGVFGAHMLLAYAAIIFTGLYFTRLAPQDERI